MCAHFGLPLDLLVHSFILFVDFMLIFPLDIVDMASLDDHLAVWADPYTLSRVGNVIGIDLLVGIHSELEALVEVVFELYSALQDVNDH